MIRGFAETPDDFKLATETLSPGTLIIYTDGAYDRKTECGGCGCVIEEISAVPAFPQNTFDRFCSLKKTTNNISELLAVDLALDTLLHLSDALEYKGKSILIVTDSKYAVGQLNKLWKTKRNQEIVANIQNKLAVSRRRHRIRLEWIRGHVGIPGNERADHLAEMGLKLAKDDSMSYTPYTPHMDSSCLRSFTMSPSK